MAQITGRSSQGNGKAKRPRAAKAKKVNEYRNSLREAVALGCAILIVDNEAKANLLRSWNIPATYSCAEHAEFLCGAHAVIVSDGDHEHVSVVATALQGIATSIRVLLLPDLPPQGDIIGWAANGGSVEKLHSLIDGAPHWMPPVPGTATGENKAQAEADEQKLIDELARLSRPDYDRRRTNAARNLGLRRGTLDNEVEARRAQQRQDAGRPPLFGHWVVKPADKLSDTDALLLQIQRRLQRHIVFSLEQAVITALWVLFTWIHEVATHSPKLLLTSAVGNCGKSTLLSLIGYLVPRALNCVSITEAPLFRSVEYWSPTLLIDEADVLLVNNEPVRAIVNGSWAKGFGVVRCIGDDNTPHFFPIFCPQAISMVGKRLPHTTLSRSIVIEMTRKLDSENVEHFNLLDDADLMQLRQQALRWSLETSDQLRNARPEMPQSFQNRLGDNFATLVAIADHAGGDWPELARTAAQRAVRRGRRRLAPSPPAGCHPRSLRRSQRHQLCLPDRLADGRRDR
jgi:hypothetical protein